MYEEGDELYMCLTDYECELGEASGGTPVYASIEDLKAARSCVSECGIVAVRVMYVKTIDYGIHPADRGKPPSNAEGQQEAACGRSAAPECYTAGTPKEDR